MSRPAEPPMAKAPAPDAESILVIVPALNEAGHIEACLNSLLGDSSWSAVLPCIVADGGSTDETRAIVKTLASRYPRLRLVDNPDRLQGAGTNLAVALGATEATRILVRCDAHATYPPGFVRGITECLDQTGADSVVIPMDSIGQSCFGRANAWIVDTPLGNGGAAHRGGQLSGWIDHGHHAGFTRQSFETVGGYDPAFSHNEDAEYDLRLTRSGGKIWLAAPLRIDYVARGTPGGLARQYFNYGRGRARTQAKHGQTLKLRQTMPVLALFGLSLGTVMAPFFPVALLLPGAYVGLLLAASVLMATKHRSACGLLCGLAAGIMHMSWAAGYLVERARRGTPNEER